MVSLSSARSESLKDSRDDELFTPASFRAPQRKRASEGQGCSSERELSLAVEDGGEGFRNLSTSLRQLDSPGLRQTASVSIGSCLSRPDDVSIM